MFFALIIVLGLFIYFCYPKYFFFFWILVHPIIVPLYLTIFPEHNPEKFYEIYFTHRKYLGYLLLIILCITILSKQIRTERLTKLLLVYASLLIFFLIQNVSVGFDIKALFQNYRIVTVFFSTFLVLYFNKRIRPSREKLLKLGMFLVFIQLVFSILNLLGYSIYPTFHTDTYETHLISGSFKRFNHMANYLAVIFLLFSLNYYNTHGENKRRYLLMMIIVGALILLSGSRMTLFLICITLLIPYYNYLQKNVFLVVFLLGIVFVGWSFLKSNTALLDLNADEGTGFERNLIGFTKLANSNNMTEGNTMSFSYMLLLKKFDNPIMGNGMSYRENSFYKIGSLNEDNFKADAALTFKLVEYGIIGLSLYLFMLYIMIRVASANLERKNTILWLIPFVFYVLFSITDEGLFDSILLSFLFVYYFSRDPLQIQDYKYANKKLRCSKKKSNICFDA